MVRLAKYSILLAFAFVLATPALAQSPIQLRFSVQPAANDPVWQSFKGATLEKEAECYYSTDTVVPKLWPQGKTGTFNAKTVLFNPGATTWSGGKQVFTPNTAPEPTNTLLMLPVGFTAQTKSIVCRASILLNGKDISTSARSLVFGLVTDIAKVGPPTANVTLDQKKLPKPTTSVMIPEVVTFNPKIVITSPRQTLTKPRKNAWCVETPGGQFLAPGCAIGIHWTMKRDSIAGDFSVVTFASQSEEVRSKYKGPTGKPNLIKFKSGQDTADLPAFQSIMVLLLENDKSKYCGEMTIHVEPEKPSTVPPATFKFTACVPFK
jgi:hypothetical protein